MSLFTRCAGTGDDRRNAGNIPSATAPSARRLQLAAALSLMAAAALGGLDRVGADPMLMVDRSSVRIRQDATIQSEALTVLHMGDEVEELRRHNEWIQVLLADGRTGWVHADLVQSRLMVEGQGVNLRSGASATRERVAVVDRGQVLGKLSQQGSWVEVSAPNGITGWVHKR